MDVRENEEQSTNCYLKQLQEEKEERQKLYFKNQELQAEIEDLKGFRSGFMQEKEVHNKTLDSLEKKQEQLEKVKRIILKYSRKPVTDKILQELIEVFNG